MKKFYQSKKFWAGVAGIITSLGALFTGEMLLQEAVSAIVSAIFTVLTVFYTKETIG